MATEDYADLDAMSHAVLNGAPETPIATSEAATVQTTKAKKPMTEKQKASLEKARITRQANAEKRKALKEKALALAKQMESSASNQAKERKDETRILKRAKVDRRAPPPPPPLDDYSDSESVGSLESYSSYSDEYSDDERPSSRRAAAAPPRGGRRPRAPAPAPASRMRQYQVKPRRREEYEEPVVRAPKLTAMEKKIEAQNARIEFIQQQITKPAIAAAPPKPAKPNAAVVKAVERLNSLNIQFDD